MRRKAHQSVSITIRNFPRRGRRTTTEATIARGVLDTGNRGAVNTSSSRRTSTARGHFRERLEALKLAHHTSNGALFVTSRAEVEYNGLARPQSEMALGGLPSAGYVTFVALSVLVIIVAGFTRRLRGR